MQKKYLIFICIVFIISLGLAFFLSPYASRSPDGLEKVLEKTGGSEKVEVANPAWKGAPLPDYTVPGVKNEKLSTGLAGVIGAVFVFVVATVLSYLLYRFAGRRKKQ